MNQALNDNIPTLEVDLSWREVQNAADTLNRWILQQKQPLRQSLAQLGLVADHNSISYPSLRQTYNESFTVDRLYRSSLPDLQNGPSATVVGARQAIEHVGISNFRLPIRFKTPGGGEISLATSVTGTVSLDGEKRGINMSRIMRSFYRYAQESFSFEVISDVLSDYETDLESCDARIQMSLSYPLSKLSLRSGLDGYQYYDICLEHVSGSGSRVRVVHLDYVYSSTCPCSLELSEHARRERGQLATPHSQRSVARISVVLKEDAGPLWFDDLIHLCRKAVPTETQVMVKREDEQAFAELNAAHPIFVEDAVRLFYEQLQTDPRIADFRVVASHQESLHSHDAISVIYHGPTFVTQSLDPHLFKSLIHVR